MQLKLQCKLKLDKPTTDIFIEGNDAGVIAEEINILEVPDGMSDEQVKVWFDQFKLDLMRRYTPQIFSFFKVELKQLKE